MTKPAQGWGTCVLYCLGLYCLCCTAGPVVQCVELLANNTTRLVDAWVVCRGNLEILIKVSPTTACHAASWVGLLQHIQRNWRLPDTERALVGQYQALLLCMDIHNTALAGSLNKLRVWECVQAHMLEMHVAVAGGSTPKVCVSSAGCACKDCQLWINPQGCDVTKLSEAVGLLHLYRACALQHPDLRQVVPAGRSVPLVSQCFAMLTSPAGTRLPASGAVMVSAVIVNV